MLTLCPLSGRIPYTAVSNYPLPAQSSRRAAFAVTTIDIRRGFAFVLGRRNGTGVYPIPHPRNRKLVGEIQSINRETDATTTTMGRCRVSMDAASLRLRLFISVHEVERPFPRSDV
jgi:hypothetical protein